MWAWILAIALSMGVVAEADIWEQPVDQSVPAVHVESVGGDVVEDARADESCLTVVFGEVAGQKAIVSGLSEYVGVQVGLVGNYLQYAFDQRGAAYQDMVLSSIDVSGLDEVVICP